MHVFEYILNNIDIFNDNKILFTRCLKVKGILNFCIGMYCIMRYKLIFIYTKSLVFCFTINKSQNFISILLCYDAFYKQIRYKNIK